MLDQAILITGLAASPVGESRLSVIYGLAIGMNPMLVLVLSLIGNLAVAPILFLIFRYMNVKRIAYRILGDRLTRLIRRAKKKLEVYANLALIFFVAIPLPGTGAWTASVVAEILDLDRKNASAVIGLGVIIATFVVFAGATGALAALKLFKIA